MDKRCRSIFFRRLHKGCFPFSRRPGATDCQHNGHIYCVLLAPGTDRQAVLRELRSHEIQSVFHYVPLHSSPAARRFGRTHGNLSLTNSLSERLIRLPMWLGMTEAKQQRVSDVLGAILKK
jgi:dTDP-4-amino-4,6-dideoxygalactose transaminase